MKRPRLLLAALALPLAALLAGLAVNSVSVAGGTDWLIPVEGYDPRSPLRGQFVRFRYDWRVAGDPRLCSGGGCQLCLSGPPPDGAAVSVQQRGAACRYAIDPGVSKLDLLPARADGVRAPRLIAQSRLFISEARAPALQAQLASVPMAVRARLTRGGRLVNQALVPRGGAVGEETVR